MLNDVPLTILRQLYWQQDSASPQFQSHVLFTSPQVIFDRKVLRAVVGPWRASPVARLNAV